MRRLLIKLLTTVVCGPCNERVEIVMSDTSSEIFHKDVRRSAQVTTKDFYKFSEKFSNRKELVRMSLKWTITRIQGFWGNHLVMFL